MRACRTLIPLLVLALHASAAIAQDTYHWIQYVPGGLEARAVTRDTSCPDVTLDGAQASMFVRAEPNAAFPVLVCTLPLPSAAKTVAVGGIPLALPKPEAGHILLIGDTGCRLLGARAQACNDIAAWPFRLNADISAQMKPDLVIHVGDYYYREQACSVGNAGCAGSHSGDTWDAWREDFFAPAATMLASAPWVFVRGNHEICARGGKGWSRMLDPYPFRSDADCRDLTPSFVADIGGVKLLVMDVSAADENMPDQTQADFYRPQFESATALGPGPVWLALHRPIWSPAGTKRGKVFGDNKTLAVAARNAIPANVQAILSGHIHTFEVMGYENDRPIQIVSGNGGDDLDRNPPAKFDGLVMDTVTIKTGRGIPRSFGFATLGRGAGEWTIIDYDTHAQALLTCRMRNRDLSCD